MNNDTPPPPLPNTIAPPPQTLIAPLLQTFNQRGINFLALDFDLTLISIHTGGTYQGSAESLSRFIRPEFYHIISLLLNPTAETLTPPIVNIAIVTFSPQVQLIKDCLTIWFGAEIADRIPIRGGDRGWCYEGGGTQGEGKQGHMASAVEEIVSSHHARLEKSGASSTTPDSELIINRSSTLLIDDDATNIKIALREGVRAIWLNPKEERGLKVLEDIIKLGGNA
jgi:hypothetical protein